MTRVAAEPLVPLLGALVADQLVVPLVQQPLAATEQGHVIHVMLLEVAHDHHVGVVAAGGLLEAARRLAQHAVQAADHAGNGRGVEADTRHHRPGYGLAHVNGVAHAGGDLTAKGGLLGEAHRHHRDLPLELILELAGAGHHEHTAHAHLARHVQVVEQALPLARGQGEGAHRVLLVLAAHLEQGAKVRGDLHLQGLVRLVGQGQRQLQLVARAHLQGQLDAHAEGQARLEHLLVAAQQAHGGALGKDAEGGDGVREVEAHRGLAILARGHPGGPVDGLPEVGARAVVGGGIGGGGEDTNRGPLRGDAARAPGTLHLIVG